MVGKKNNHLFATSPASIAVDLHLHAPNGFFPLAEPVPAAYLDENDMVNRTYQGNRTQSEKREHADLAT
jgi:hypothetical protein